MLKKRMVLSILLISFLSIIFFALPVLGAANDETCCISANGCEVMFGGDEALCAAKQGTFSNVACTDDSLASQCSIGCCTTHGGALRQPKYKNTCDAAGGELVSVKPFEASIPADICGGLLECQEDAQCPANTRCTNGICIPGARAEVSRCENTVQDAGESDVDCGGTCPPCAQEKKCATDRDCRAGLTCSTDTHRCAVQRTNCRNGIVDAGEDCDFEAGSNRMLFKQGTTSCADVEFEPGKKFSGGTLNCNSFCRFDTATCTYIPPSERRTAPTGVCGDGTLNTPNKDYFVETCEIGIDRCAVGSACGCTNPDQCGPTDCTCSPACETPAPTITTFQTDAQDMTHLQWAIPEVVSACLLASQHVRWCDNKKTNCAALPKSQWQSSADINSLRREFQKKTDDTVCVAVELNYQNKPAVTSDHICREECVEGQRFCDSTDVDKRKTNICSTGVLGSGEPCTAGTYCTEPSAGAIECKAPELCSKCNGAFQIFAGVLFDKPGVAAQQACEQLMGCTYDKSEKTVNQFRSCQDVQSCYGYRTKYACENDESHCKVAAGGCTWKTTNADLGLGICAPATQEKQQCSACSTQAPAAGNANPVLVGCDKQSCALFGDACYFSTGENTCEDVKSLGCDDYNDAGKPARAEKECVGDRLSRGGTKEVEIDARYDGAVRASGTNRISQRSNDLFSFGLCKWGSEPGERCFKDADGNGVDDCSFVQNPQECNRDFAAPETSVVAEKIKQDTNGRLKIGKFMDIPVRVSEPATTFFCLDHDCYPKNYTMCKIQKVLSAGDQSASRLNFYSQDRANNLEEVKHADIVVNINPPRKVHERVLSISADSPRELLVNLEYTEDVVCNAKLTNIKGDEVPADDTPAALLKSNAITDEHGRAFTRSFHNLKDDIYVFTYGCVNDFGNTDHGQEVKIIDTNKIHVVSGTFGGSEPITGARNIIARVQTDEPATCYINPMGTNREFVSFNAGDAEHMQESTERKEHTKNVELKDDLNVFQVACQFDGQQQLDGNRADRIVISKDIFAPSVRFFGTIDKTVALEPGNYGTAQNVFAYCSDSRVKDQYGLEGLDGGCGDVSMTVNGQPLAFAFAPDQTEGFISPFTPFLVGNSVQGGTATLEISGVRAADKQHHESVTFDREAFKISVADTGTGTIADTARVTIFDALGNELQPTPPPRIPKDSYRIKINTGRAASLDTMQATIFATGMILENGVLKIQGEKKNAGTISRADCQLEGVSTISCGVDLRRLQLENAGGDEKDFYTLEVQFEPVSVTEKGTDCFPGERASAQLAMMVQPLTITLVTATPEVQLEPIFSSVFFDAGEEWVAFSDENEYPIKYYPDEGLAYTNQRELFVTGVLKHPDITKKIEYYTGRCGGAQIKQKEFDPHEDFAQQRDALTTTAVNPPTGIMKTLTINTLPIDLTGKFLQFSPVVDDTGKVQKEYHRTGYGAYRHHYAIANVKLGTPNNLTLDAPLEEVPVRVAGQVGIPVNIFAKPTEENVFGEPVALEEGCNTFAAKGVGSILGDDIVVSRPSPDPTSLAGIIVDSQGPRVVQNSPAEGTTNEQITNVSIVVEEGSDGTFDAPLIPDSISVTIIPAESASTPAEESAESSETIIDGEGCERNVCTGTDSEVEYTYFLVSDRLVNENTGAFMESGEKQQLLETFGWDTLHDEYLDAELGGENKNSEGIITARLADHDGKMVMKKEELEGKRRYTITYRNGEPFTGGGLVIFKGFDKATNQLAPSQTGKPSWAFNTNEGTPQPPVWEFLAPAVKNNGTFYTSANGNVKIDYSANQEPVVIGDQNADGSINGRLFVKRFDAPLGQEDPMPARCERVQRNVFVCNQQDFTPEQFNKAYTLVAEARLKLSNDVEGPAGRHVSPVLVVDNQAPHIMSYDIPAAVAYNGVLRITLQVQDSGFDLKGRAVFDVPERPDLRREIPLTQAEHQIGTNNYVFEWNLEPERFRLTDEELLGQPHSLTVFVDDYANNVPAATITRDVALDFRGPDENAWKVDINTPFSIPEENKYFTREAVVKINGSFADNDICPTCLFVTPGNYLPGADTYDNQLMATILELPAKRFTTNLRLKAVENQVVNKTYTIMIKDIAGFNKTKTFTIVTDRRPPAQVSLNII
ncbi:MAG: hypothetical protein Q7R76_02110 [Candidatus Woesearchaeota archaeon]|nr:hypothetical protein [Candidatus Woesearchaeota archaeon]